MSRLELRWRERERRMPEQQTSREYLDFVIDGVPLWDLLLAGMRRGYLANSTATDLIGCLGWSPKEESGSNLAAELLGEEDSKLKTGRTLLYVCPECGDVGCGAITCVVSKDCSDVIWQRFAREVNYRYNDDDLLFNETGFEGIGPFRFDISELRAALLHPPAKEAKS